MNSKRYELWVKSHQIEKSDFDIADVVMEHIARQACKPGGLRSALDLLVLNLVQAKAIGRILILACGALVGLLRMFWQIYSVLFM